MDLNILNWNWNEKAAAGRHVLSYAAGGLTVLAGWHFLSPQDASAIGDSLNTIWDGLIKVGTGVATLLGTLIPIYTALTAKKSAEPANQIKSVVTNADPEGRNKLIAAVSKMDEVRAIVVPESLAGAVPSEKVVGSPAAAAQLPLAVAR